MSGNSRGTSHSIRTVTRPRRGGKSCPIQSGGSEAPQCCEVSVQTEVETFGQTRETASRFGRNCEGEPVRKVASVTGVPSELA